MRKFHINLEGRYKVRSSQGLGRNAQFFTRGRDNVFRPTMMWIPLHICGVPRPTLRKKSRHFEKLYGVNVRIGVGIHYGNVVVGTVGAGDRQRLTAIGDSVNFASRIESANKIYGTELLISSEVHRQIADRITIGMLIEQAVIEGKTGQHVLYEVKGLK